MRQTTLEPLQADPNHQRARARVAQLSVSSVVRRALLAAALLCAAAGPARADDEATTAIARERFKEGVQFFDQKNYDKARAAFLQAYALKRHPAVLLNLAQSELRSGHEADAASHFAQFLRESKEATDAERQSAEAGLTAAKAVITEVTVTTDEDGALLFVDGNGVGPAPLPSPLYLAPGAHTLSAKKDSREVSIQFTAVAGQSTSTTLRFKRPGAAAPVTEAATQPAAPPPQPVESEPPPPASEEHAGRTRKPFFKWATSSPLAITGELVTLAGIGVGVSGALIAKWNYDSANSIAGQLKRNVAEDVALMFLAPGSDSGICARPDWQAMTAARYATRPSQYAAACNKYRQRSDTGDKWKTVAIAGSIVAGAAAVTTVVLYFVDGYEPATQTGNKPRRSFASVAPWYSGTERGLVVVGEF